MMCTFYIMCQRKSADDLEKFNWILGTWKMQVKNGYLYESWNYVNDTTLQSRGFIVKITGDTIINETVQLCRRNKTYYYVSTVANQNKQEPVNFKITTVSEKAFVAENPEHDFPQRISYELKAVGKLSAFIDGKIGGQYRKQEFLFTKE